MRYIVKATDNYKKHNILDAELGRIPAPGEKFTVNSERLAVLQGGNDRGIVFVEVVKECETPKKGKPKSAKQEKPSTKGVKKNESK